MIATIIENKKKWKWIDQIFAALFLIAGAFASATAFRLARQKSQLFAASLAELRHDENALKPRETVS